MTNTPSIELLQGMDESAWAALQGMFFRRIYFYVKRYVGDHQTAEDLTQDVFLGAVKGISRFDPAYSLDQFLFGIARNRVVDHFRRHKIKLVPPKGDQDGDLSALWLENMAESDAVAPPEGVVDRENTSRRRKVLAKILKDYVAELWEAGDFKKLQVLEYLFVMGGRNKNAALRFGITDEKLVAGIKFRAIERLRGLARQNDPNHSLFGALWRKGAR